jgi:ACT domain-containing protein
VTALTGTFSIDRATCAQSVTDLMERMRSLDLVEDAA